MLNKWNTLLRVTFFLLLSVAVHAGAVFYDWGGSVPEAHRTMAPVTISLIAIDKSQPVRTVAAEKHQAVAPAEKIARKQPRPVTKQIQRRPPEVVREKGKVVRAEPPAIAKPPAEQICAPPKATDCATEDIAVVASLSETPQVSRQTPDIEVEAAGEALAPTTTSATGPLSDAVPRYRSNPLPEYPYLARQKHWEGVVWLRVEVTEDGQVDDVNVEESSGHAVLDREARRTVRRWRFSPAERAGVPVSSQVRIPVRFRLEDS